MRFSIRLALPLALVIAAVAFVVTPLIDRYTQKWFVRDLDIRSRLVSEVLRDELATFDAKEIATASSRARVQRTLDRLVRDERIYALAICDANRQKIAATDTFAAALTCNEATSNPADRGEVVQAKNGPLHLFIADLSLSDGTVVHSVVAHDVSFMTKRSQETRRAFFGLFLFLLVLVASLSVLVAHLTWKGWLRGVRELLDLAKSTPKISRKLLARAVPELRPIARDLRDWAHEAARASGQRDPSQITWSPEALRSILQKELSGEEILIVSNREPYIHTRVGDTIQVQVPASGLVTALEPVMRACSGTWIAHGSGSADRETVDRGDHVRVPPKKPAYQIRRVWLTPEEEKGYYYGFANEGLWPLCHIAHTRPTFRSEDFEQYRKVNALFAKAVLEEAKTQNPVILVQDYHLALLPRLIREKLPEATIITFWHIPWPNSEAFGICPWREEILAGLLGSSILGFHTRFHCHNFLDSVDRYLEARIERETMTISYGSELTKLNAYPISIDWPPRRLEEVATTEECRRRVRERHHLSAGTLLAIGVDRLDYTKGILERFNGVERFLDLNPSFRGRFSLVQIGAPTRSNIFQYRQFVEQVRAEAERINTKFAADGSPTILLLERHHEPEEIFEYFRAAEMCLVTSLHDGMNLVAKEFIGARDDEDGVLILSQFAGAARELPEAIVVNPYDVDQCADAIRLALALPIEERRMRMKSMRAYVQEFNVYRWAGRMLIDAARLRRLAGLKRSRTEGLEASFSDFR
ncbi:MAG: trehalose-6-phosphate synthase [Bdellovibrionales bacterium]|nr:trehalose-6-phosphate synthase [Bdellovibrionales bacterium]